MSSKISWLAGGETLGKKGNNKDHLPDLNQTVIDVEFLQKRMHTVLLLLLYAADAWTDGALDRKRKLAKQTKRKALSMVFIIFAPWNLVQTPDLPVEAAKVNGKSGSAQDKDYESYACTAGLNEYGAICV